MSRLNTRSQGKGHDVTGPYLYVSCDALTMKGREGGRVVKTSVLLATGVNAEGYRELLGMQVATAESVTSWT